MRAVTLPPKKTFQRRDSFFAFLFPPPHALDEVLDGVAQLSNLLRVYGHEAAPDCAIGQACCAGAQRGNEKGDSEGQTRRIIWQ